LGVSTKPGRTVSNFAVALFATLLTDFYPSTGWNACYVKVSFLSVNQPVDWQGTQRLRSKSLKPMRHKSLKTLSYSPDCLLRFKASVRANVARLATPIW
ncbi:MAG: hypothetical protein ACFB9N_13840, partial [Geitlerinemataceae cyanobacterium]